MPSPSLTPDILKCHGITYDEVVIDSYDLYHINTVREGLLDFDNFLIRDIVRSVLVDPRYNHDEIPESAFRDSGNLDKWEQEVLLEFIKAAKKISYDTQQLESTLRAEPSWQYLFKDTIFKPRKDPRSSRPFAEQISYVSDGTEQWNEAHSIRDLSKAHDQPTIPKPDFYFGFSIYDAKLYRNYGFEKADLFQNFTTGILFHLKERGLCSAPTSGFTTCMKERVEKNKNNAIAQHDLLCFPWAVVELKKFREGNNNSPTTEAYCQAANAGSTALCMLESLTQFSEAKRNNQHIPPVVTFTCVGGKSKVWLAYSHPTSDSKRDHRMICIWEGSLSNIWDAIQFCRIADNASFWAQDILKRQISEYIGQWRAKFPIPSAFSKVYQSATQTVSHNLSYSSSPSRPTQSVTTLEEKRATTIQTTTIVGRDIKLEHNSSLYETVQENNSHQIISNETVESKRSLLSLPFGGIVDRHTPAEPAGLKSETTESSPMLSQEAKRFDRSTAIFKGSHQKPFGLFDSTTAATIKFKTPESTPSKSSTRDCPSTTKFSHYPFVVNEPDSPNTEKYALQSISCWPKYRDYSPEELRLVDYAQCHKFSNCGVFFTTALLDASNREEKSNSSACSTQKSLFGLTQTQDTGFNKKTITSGVIFEEQSKTSLFSGTVLQSPLASDLVFEKERQTDPINSDFLRTKIQTPPPKNPFISTRAGENLAGGKNGTQPSSTDPFAAFKQTARVPWNLKNGKLTRPSTPEFTMDFPLSHLKSSTISVNQDVKSRTLDQRFIPPKIFGTPQVNIVGPSKMNELNAHAKAIPSLAKGLVVLSPRNSKISLGESNTEELAVVPLPRLMDSDLQTMYFSVGKNRTEEACEPGAKTDYDDIQQGDEIRPKDNIEFEENGRLSDITGSSPERIHVKLFPGEGDGGNALKLPSFITGEGSLDIAFQNIEFERDNEEERLITTYVTFNENGDEDDDRNWEDISSDENEPELRAGDQAYQSIRRVSLIGKGRKESAGTIKHKGGIIVQQRRFRAGFCSRNF